MMLPVSQFSGCSKSQGPVPKSSIWPFRLWMKRAIKKNGPSFPAFCLGFWNLVVDHLVDCHDKRRKKIIPARSGGTAPRALIHHVGLPSWKMPRVKLWDFTQNFEAWDGVLIPTSYSSKGTCYFILMASQTFSEDTVIGELDGIFYNVGVLNFHP